MAAISRGCLARFFNVPTPALRLTADFSNLVFCASAVRKPRYQTRRRRQPTVYRTKGVVNMQTLQVKGWRPTRVHTEHCSTTWRSGKGTHQRRCTRLNVVTKTRKRSVPRDDGETHPRVRCVAELLQPQVSWLLRFFTLTRP